MTFGDPISEAWLEPSPQSVLLSAAGHRAPEEAAGEAPEDEAENAPVPLVWHEASPGGDLAQLVESFERLGLDELSDFDLVELTAAAGRIASWAHHVAASAASELAERPAMEAASPEEFSASLTPTRLAGEEIALRLGTSGRAGARLVREGTLFAAHLSATGDALRSGAIDAAKARAIVDGLEGVPLEIALGVQDMILPRAPRRTARQLAADVRAAIVELDPPEAVARRREAMRNRHVTKPVPLGDGMAGLWLRTGAVEATALYESVDRAARRARIRGDGRTLDQLRADLLVERALHPGSCSVGQGGLRSPEATVRAGAQGAEASVARTGEGSAKTSGPATRCPDAVRVDVRVLVPLSTLLGTRDEAALLVGHGPIDPDLARSLARGGTWRRLVTDPESGTILDVGKTRYVPPTDLAEHVRFRDLGCVRPGCETSAWHAELDHIAAFHPAHDRGGPTSDSNLAPLSKGCHQLKTHGGFHLERSSPSSYRWRTPTDHVYVNTVSPGLRALAARDPIHRAREDLDLPTRSAHMSGVLSDPGTRGAATALPRSSEGREPGARPEPEPPPF